MPQGNFKLNVFKSFLCKTIEMSLSFADGHASSDMSHFCGVGHITVYHLKPNAINFLWAHTTKRELFPASWWYFKEQKWKSSEKSFVLASKTETLPQNYETCLISDTKSASPFNNEYVRLEFFLSCIKQIHLSPFFKAFLFSFENGIHRHHSFLTS